MIQERCGTSDKSGDGIRTIKFHRKYLLHNPYFSRPGGTKKMQVVLSGRGNVVVVLIREISISQAYLISLWPLCFILLGLAQCSISFLGWQSSFIYVYLTLLHFYAHIVGLLDWKVDCKPSREAVSSRISHY